MASQLYSDSSQDLPNILRNVTSISREKFTFIWNINQFGEFMKRKYEFLSPVFSPKSAGTSQWKLMVFPENVYPEGVCVALRLLKASNDDRCYSVMYTISLIDANGKDHQLQTREKVFRNYLDYDECSITSNQVIKEKCLLQNDVLIICCKIDLLFCENQDNTIPNSLESYENVNTSSMNDLSCLNTFKKSTECQKNISSLSELSNNMLQAPTGKINAQYDCTSSKTHEGLEILSNDLNSLYANKYQHDVTIHVDDGRIRAHKIILATRSDYFRQTYMQHAADDEIHIPGIKSITLDAVLYYLYTGQSPQLTYDYAIDLLSACNIFNLAHLRGMVQNFLKSQISVSNAIDILRISKEMKLDTLKKCALKFVAENHEEVSKTLKWNQMMRNDPHSAGEILLTTASFQNKLNRY